MKHTNSILFLRQCAIALPLLLMIACDDTPAPTVPVISVSPDKTATASVEQKKTARPSTASVAEEPLRAADLGYFTPLAEECCTQPGAASECWMNDAEEDGVLCDANSDCASDSCNITKGRCNCETDEDCNDGVCMNGVCGPSWCNGYLKCSCWGGCEWWAGNVNYTLHDLAASQGMYCCEGLYAQDPVDVDPALGGHFSEEPCGGCTTDEHCDDDNPCTSDSCVDGICANTALNGTQDTVPSAADCIFDGSTYSAECARTMCINGVCGVEATWKEGESCNSAPGTVPDGAEADCYTRTCAADGTCGVTVLEGQSCNAGENPCSNATCNASAACVDAPLNAAALAANPGCCDPAVASSFDDGHGCTDDYCCNASSSVSSCDNQPVFTVQNVPNYDPASPGDCCLDSLNCSDGNDCTQNICCGTANAALDICGADASNPSWECVSSIRDIPGCCNDAPASLADNCNDIFDCTENICCTPDAIADAVDGDACFGETPYNCASALAYDPPPAGCCDPSQDAGTFCDDGNVCTNDTCDSLTHQCEADPQPLIDGCCGPNREDECGDADNNACTDATCCDPDTISDASSGDPCFGAAAWTCAISVVSIPGCCTTAAECDDGNPCTADTCVNNTCTFETLNDLSAVDGLCCTVGGINSSQCADDNDPGDCTQNVCCSPAMIAGAVDGDPCYNANSWSCRHQVENPLPAGCCTASTFAADCSNGGVPGANRCVKSDCENNNCVWTSNFSAVPSYDDKFCCGDDGDCPAVDGSHPCLSSSSCDMSGDPLINTGYAQCDLTYKAENTPCGPGGDCFNELCSDPANKDWTCSKTENVPAALHVACSPPNSPPCGVSECDGTGACVAQAPSFNSPGNDVCTASTLGAGDITETDQTNACANDDYEPDNSGIFSECSGETYSDVTFNYDDAVSNAYELKHPVIRVASVTGGWNPIIYTRTECGTASTQTACNDNCNFNGSNYDGIGNCIGNESTVIPAPLAVADVPWHDTTTDLPDPTSPAHEQDFDRNEVLDGYYVENTFTSSLIVDSRYTTPTYGGTFDMTITRETHINNDCRNIGSYAAAPLIDGNIQWKQRWRGTTTTGDYLNYFGNTGPAMGMIDPVTAADPHQAFFRVDIPAGSGQYLAYVDYKGLRKRGEAGYQASLDAATLASSAADEFFDAALSLLKPDAANPNDCTATGMQTVSYENWGPARLKLNTDESGWGTRWLAVSNREAEDYGDYELNIVKQQPDFFGFVSTYSGQGQEKCGTMGDFDAEGTRLDFIPSGSTQNGYLMTIKTIGDGPDSCGNSPGHSEDGSNWGWLVHPRCYGSSGNGAAITYNDWDGLGKDGYYVEIPFYFPMGQKAYNHLYIESSGRVLPLERMNPVGVNCSDSASCNAYATCSDAPRRCVCEAVGTGRKCFLNPGNVDIEPSYGKIFVSQEDGGYGPMLAAAWGTFTPTWAKSRSGNGYITAQTVIFEGTTSFAISWVAMDIDTSTGLAEDAMSDYSGADHTYSLPSWQMILRPDGRIVYYYRPRGYRYTSTVWETWDEAVERGTFVLGLSGGIAADSDCYATFCQSNYGSQAQCDNSSPHSDYKPSKRCYREIHPLVQDSKGLGNE